MKAPAKHVPKALCHGSVADVAFPIVCDMVTIDSWAFAAPIICSHLPVRRSYLMKWLRKAYYASRMAHRAHVRVMPTTFPVLGHRSLLQRLFGALENQHCLSCAEQPSSLWLPERMRRGARRMRAPRSRGAKVDDKYVMQRNGRAIRKLSVIESVLLIQTENQLSRILRYPHCFSIP